MQEKNIFNLFNIMIDNEEDPVEEEIPVYSAKTLENNLYVFQYPNKSNQPNFATQKVVNCCVKPINQEVKVDFALNTESTYYDTFKGEQIALAADGKISNSKTDRPTFRSGIMDKQTYTSVKSIENVNKYVVAILQDNEIHLSALTNILQLRPNFSYFDKQDKRIRAEQKATTDETEDDEMLQQVTVKFSRQDTERLKKTREKTYDYLVKKSADEPWCEMLWHPSTSSASNLEKQKLFAMRSESTEHALSLNNKEYIEKIIPHERSDQNLESILPPRVINKMKLKTMTLTEQLKSILKDAKMLSFNEIMSILEDCDKEITSEKVLRTLPLVGILIRGNWTAQSEVLYPPESVSNNNGVSAELMIRGRDYILFKLSKQDSLYRRNVIISTQLPPDEVDEILRSVGRINMEKKWELLLSPDNNFEIRYPELVQRQEMVFRARESQFHGMDYEKSPKRVRKRSIREPKIEKN